MIENSEKNISVHSSSSTSNANEILERLNARWREFNGDREKLFDVVTKLVIENPDKFSVNLSLDEDRSITLNTEFGGKLNGMGLLLVLKRVDDNNTLETVILKVGPIAPIFVMSRTTDSNYGDSEMAAFMDSLIDSKKAIDYLTLLTNENLVFPKNALDLPAWKDVKDSHGVIVFMKSLSK